MGIRSGIGRGSPARRVRHLVGLAGLALMAAGCIVPGTHTVSSFGAGGVSPGLWRTLGGDDCYWARRSGFGDGDIIASRVSHGGPRYVQIEASDAGFEQSGCAPFWQEPGPFARPLATPGQPFGEGEFAIGYEIAPGRYRAPGAERGGGCSWERVSGWDHDDDIFAKGFSTGGQQTIEIQASDVGFSSDGCGTWTKIG